MNSYERLLKDAEEKLEEWVEREVWSEANNKAGYRDGIKSFKFHLDNMSKEERDNRRAKAQLDQNFAIEHGNYGLAAYYTSWFNGWSTAETACRLDELEAMGLK